MGCKARAKPGPSRTTVVRWGRTGASNAADRPFRQVYRVFWKQSLHFRLEVSLGSNGKEVIALPQPAQVHLPSNIFRSPRSLFWRGALPFCFWWQSRHIRPSSLLGSNGNSVIVAPQPLHFQFPWCIFRYYFYLPPIWCFLHYTVERAFLLGTRCISFLLPYSARKWSGECRYWEFVCVRWAP